MPGFAEGWAVATEVFMVTVAVPVKEVPGVMVAGTSMVTVPCAGSLPPP